jgi:aminomethyltransferase
MAVANADFVSSERAYIEAQKSAPAEIGLGWAVNFKKPFFIGKRALVEEQKRGVSKKFMGLEITWEVLERLYGEIGLAPQLSHVASRVGVPVYLGGRQVGKATTSCWSTLLKKFIALATLDTPQAEPGTSLDLEITVEYVRKRAAARVVPLPFFDPERKRA